MLAERKYPNYPYSHVRQASTPLNCGHNLSNSITVPFLIPFPDDAFLGTPRTRPPSSGDIPGSVVGDEPRNNYMKWKCVIYVIDKTGEQKRGTLSEAEDSVVKIRLRRGKVRKSIKLTEFMSLCIIGLMAQVSMEGPSIIKGITASDAAAAD